ncbi:MAG: carboxypeptidase-like regulatory domain-containing protein [Candidatus Caenarcaniphilales bacterium]|nr:carboxypeptidase-like regulatory domain-containing protein [Candidatus Caenarcaniphilales bacterium]
MSGGSISGYVDIKDIDGKIKDAVNIIVIALDENDKEVAYTYTDQSGEYTLSELPPGKYKITLDPLDIKNRKLKIKDTIKKVEIPFSIDEIIEVNDINFNVLQSNL